MVNLSQEPNKIVSDPLEYLTWIFGAYGVGKTSWAAQAPDTWFAKTEQGTKGVAVYGDVIIDWASFLAYCNVLANGVANDWKDQRIVRTVVIDTLDNLYNMCGTWVCDNTEFDGKRFKFPEDVTYGRAYKRISRLLVEKFLKLQALGFGVILISHEYKRSFKWAGADMVKSEPNISPSSQKAIGGQCDCIGYFYVKEKVEQKGSDFKREEVERRQMWQPTFVVNAKHRLQGFPNELLLPPGKGWATYCEAFTEAVRKNYATDI